MDGGKNVQLSPGLTLKLIKFAPGIKSYLGDPKYEFDTVPFRVITVLNQR